MPKNSKEMKHFFWWILLFSATKVAGQQVWYEGPAVWIPAEGAVEKFQHAARDRDLQLTGKYQWQLQRPMANGAIELISIATQFKHGKVEGTLQFSRYEVRLGVSRFDQQAVLTEAVGTHTTLNAFFQAGKPTGHWQLSSGPHPKGPGASLAIQYWPANQLWEFLGEGQKLSGQLTGDAALAGSWTWQQDSLQYRYQFERGILRSIEKQGVPVAEQAFADLRTSLAAEPHLSWQPDTSLVFNPGLRANDSILLLQGPWQSAFGPAQSLWQQASDWVGQHPLIRMPPVPHMSRPYIPLDSTLIDQTLVNDLVHYVDSLNRCLQAPSLLLRAGTDARLDSLQAEAEQARDQAAGLLADYHAFLAKTGRYQLVSAWPSVVTNPRNQAEWLEQWKVQARLQRTRLRKYATELYHFRSQFREEAALQDLEKAWLAQLTHFEGQLKPDERHLTGLMVWTNLKERYLPAQKEAYTALDDLAARRQFLRLAMEEWQGVLHFFEQSGYPYLTEAPNDFQKAYTQMLYNPYMGVNNIEQVQRRKLLAYFKASFWPWWCQQWQVIDRPQALFEQQERSKALYDAIMALGSDASKEANRLEKRIRRENSPERVLRLLLEYQRKLESRAATTR